MPSPMLIMGILLALSLAGNALLSKLYVGAKQDVARVEQAYNSFKAQVKVEGETAAKKAAEDIAAHKLAKEKADAENVKTKSDLAGLYAAYRSLRDSTIRASSGILPAASPGAASPQTITFDRTGLDRALSGFDKGVTGLIERGDKAIVDLNTAKAWAQR
jgi:hypothetical protein